MNLTEAEDIKKRWQEYTEELYKKDLHDPDNHDGAGIKHADILHFRQILYYLSHQGSPVLLQQLVTELFTAGVFLAVLEAEHWALSLLWLLSSYTASVSTPSLHHVT